MCIRDSPKGAREQSGVVRHLGMGRRRLSADIDSSVDIADELFERNALEIGGHVPGMGRKPFALGFRSRFGGVRQGCQELLGSIDMLAGRIAAQVEIDQWSRADLQRHVPQLSLIHI